MGVMPCARLPRTLKLFTDKSEEFLRCYTSAFQALVNVRAMLYGDHSGRYPMVAGNGQCGHLCGQAPYQDQDFAG